MVQFVVNACQEVLVVAHGVFIGDLNPCISMYFHGDFPPIEY